MDLSIIIPCHNLERYIYPLLSTLSNQILENTTVEVIFVLDNCTDNTENIIEEWRSKLSQFKLKLIEGSYFSCGIARNAGLDIAEGDYVWFVDGDDWIVGEKTIAILVNAMKEKQLNMLRFDFLSIYNKNIRWPMVWQYMIKRDFIGDWRFTNIQPHEDVKFISKLLKDNGDSVTTVNWTGYFYNYLRQGSNIYQFFNNNGKITQ